jgi:hypothetical protein
VQIDDAEANAEHSSVGAKHIVRSDAGIEQAAVATEIVAPNASAPAEALWRRLGGLKCLAHILAFSSASCVSSSVDGVA